jgi:hypothetical protein
MIILGYHISRVEPGSKQDLLNKLQKIMLTQNELVAALKAALSVNTNNNDRLVKIGKEIDTQTALIVKLQEIISQGGAITPELEKAAADLAKSIDASAALTGQLDDKNPDSPQV